MGESDGGGGDVMERELRVERTNHRVWPWEGAIYENGRYMRSTFAIGLTRRAVTRRVMRRLRDYDNFRVSESHREPV